MDIFDVGEFTWNVTVVRNIPHTALALSESYCDILESELAFSESWNIAETYWKLDRGWPFTFSILRFMYPLNRGSSSYSFLGQYKGTSVVFQSLSTFLSNRHCAANSIEYHFTSFNNVQFLKYLFTIWEQNFRFILFSKTQFVSGEKRFSI